MAGTRYRPERGTPEQQRAGRGQLAAEQGDRNAKLQNGSLNGILVGVAAALLLVRG